MRLNSLGIYREAGKKWEEFSSSELANFIRLVEGYAHFVEMSVYPHEHVSFQDIEIAQAKQMAGYLQNILNSRGYFPLEETLV